jgi:hypothetical protein
VEPIPAQVDDRHRLALKRAYGDRLDQIAGMRVGDLTAQRFCELWTQVEAAVKLDGRGLRADPRANPHLVAQAKFYSFPHDGHILTVATRRAISTVVVPWANSWKFVAAGERIVTGSALP